MTQAARSPSLGFKPLVPEAIVAERYRVRRVIGQGGMGQVVEAEHVALGRPFALKVLRLERWNDELVRRFNREARALAKLTTPRVAQVTDFGVDEGAGPFYVMELLDGETLEDRLERETTLPPRVVLSIALEVADALAEVHAAGIVHRDLKPSNVGLTRSGPVGIKLLDFGLAAAMDDTFLSRITQSQQVLGSLPYMAPEQFNGAPTAPTIDVYALGVVIYEALAGRMPFLAPSTAALIHLILSTPVPALPEPVAAVPGLVPLISRLLEKDARARIPSAAAAAAAIREVLAGLGGPVQRSAIAPETRAVAPTPLPRTEEARAASVGHMPTLMADSAPPVESGMRLSRPNAPPPTEPSQPAYAVPTAAALAAPASPPPMAPYPSHTGYPTPPMPHPSMAHPQGVPPNVASAYPAAPPRAGTSLAFRLAVVGLLGVIFAGLSAIAVIGVLSLLDGRGEPRRPPPRAAEATPPPPPPALTPTPVVVAPGETAALGEPAPPPGIELGATTPEPVEPGERPASPGSTHEPPSPTPEPPSHDAPPQEATPRERPAARLDPEPTPEPQIRRLAPGPVPAPAPAPGRPWNGQGAAGW